MKTNIIAVHYREGAFVPLNPVSVSKSFHEGDLCFLKVDRKRYWPRHQWFMALMRDVWISLSDELREKYPHPDILRKRLLISAGYAHIRSFACSSNDEAKRFAFFIEPSIDNYTVMSVKDSIVVLMTAMSQAIDAMGEDTFRKSCDDVIEEISKLTGSSIEDLRAHAAELRAKKRKSRKPVA